MNEFIFQRPAIYKIKVKGVISKDWSERYGGMQINVERSRDSEKVTVLIGRISDQSALSGILNTLYENQFSIISIDTLED